MKPGQPELLSLEDVLAIHLDQTRRYGGSQGVRDMGLLKSAVAMPAATFGGRLLHVDIYEMAAAYVFHLVQNHPFVDGNKRVGAVAADVFLALNGIELVADEESYALLVLSIARGDLAKPEIADFFRSNTKLK
jgi:death on curing protein